MPDVVEDSVIRLRLDPGNVAPASEAASKAIAKIGGTGEVSAKQTAAAMRQLPAQLTDVATQLAGGANPLLVLLQQGGQVKDSFGGIGPALRGIGAAAAAVNPLTVALGALAAVGGSVAYGFIAGQNESTELRKSLAVTGNQAATTMAQLDRMSQGIAAGGRVTIGAARDITAGLVDLGTFGGAGLEAASKAAGALAAATGKSAEAVVKELAQAATAPTQFAERANAAYHFLTAAQYEQIRALEAQGRVQEAARLGLEALADTMAQRTVPQLGLLDRTLLTVKTNFSDFLDTLKSIGRDATPEERIARLNANLAELAKSGRKGYVFGPSAEEIAAERDALINQAGRDAVRNAERAMRQQVEDGKIQELAGQHQQALAGVERSGAALRLAQQQAALADSSRSLELAFQRDEVSAQAYQQARLAIELAGIRAQETALAAQRAAEQARKPGKPEEVLAQQAALLNLQAQGVALAERRRALLEDEAAGRRDVAPKARGDDPRAGLRALTGIDYEGVDKYLADQRNRWLVNDKAFLQDLADQNERAGIMAMEDERARGEALIELDRKIALRRLGASDLSPEARQRGGSLIDDKASLDRTQLNREMSRGTYDDLRGSISAALQDSSGNPIKTFAQTLGRAVYNRMAEALADSLARAALFGDGKGGGGLMALLGAVGSGSSGGSVNLGENTGWYDGSHAMGLNYVPWDGYRALLHRGERVQTAEQARAQDAGAAAGGVSMPIVIQGDASANTVRAIRNEQAAMLLRASRRLT